MLFRQICTSFTSVYMYMAQQCDARYTQARACGKRRHSTRAIKLLIEKLTGARCCCCCSKAAYKYASVAVLASSERRPRLFCPRHTGRVVWRDSLDFDCDLRARTSLPRQKNKKFDSDVSHTRAQRQRMSSSTQSRLDHDHPNHMCLRQLSSHQPARRKRHHNHQVLFFKLPAW